MATKTKQKYVVLDPSARLQIARDMLRGAEDALYRAVLGSPDPDNDANVAAQKDRVTRLQDEYSTVESEATSS